jgi:hypothetical protein
MFYWTDLHLEREVDDLRIVRALAKAFGLPGNAVAVVDVNDDALTAWDRRGLKVFAQRDNLDRSGDEFPVTLMITLRREDDVEWPLDKVRAIATELGVAMMTDVETEGDFWRLVMPDGHDRLVVNDDAAESRGELALRQSDREALERHRAAHVA